MKRSKKCPKCSSLQVGYIGYQPDLGANHSYNLRAFGVADGQSFFISKKFVGTLEAYVCTECGYYESYVAAPEAFDWPQVNGLVMVNAAKPEPEGPFR